MKTSLPKKFADRKFLKIKTLKRNKQIYNIDEIDTYEKMESQKRRTPFLGSNRSDIDDKFQQSFLNSTTVYSNKLEYDIERHREKVGNSFFSSKNHTKCIYFQDEATQISSAKNEKQAQIRGVAMDKMITREYRDSLDIRQSLNEQRYNNYCLAAPQDEKTRSFEKYLSREQLQKLRSQSVPDSNPEIPIIYEKFFYPSNTFSVGWEYKKQKWSRGPIYYKKNRQSSIDLHEIGPQRIQKGRRMSSSSWNKTITNFNLLSQKENPSQFERTFYSPLMNFRNKKVKAENEGKSIKIKRRPTKPQFQRWQVCNAKYFQLNPRFKRKQIRVYTE